MHHEKEKTTLDLVTHPALIKCMDALHVDTILAGFAAQQVTLQLQASLLDDLHTLTVLALRMDASQVDNMILAGFAAQQVMLQLQTALLDDPEPSDVQVISSVYFFSSFLIVWVAGSVLCMVLVSKHLLTRASAHHSFHVRVPPPLSSISCLSQCVHAHILNTYSCAHSPA